MQKLYTLNQFTKRIVFVTTFLIALFFGLYSYFIQTSIVKETIQSDTKVMANIVFENLFLAMQKGATKQELDAIIETIESKMIHTKIQIYYKRRWSENSFLRDITKTKTSLVHNDGGDIHFYTPIIFEQKCFECHTDANVGDVAAIMHFQSPLTEVKISLEDITLMLLALFSISVGVLFFYWFFLLKRYFATPIEYLLHKMNETMTHEDLLKPIQIDTKISEIKQIEVMFNAQNKKLFDSYKRLENISNTDKLTSVYNRKKFEEVMREHQESPHNFALVLIDLNRFKLINDMYGHHIGDMVLIQFVAILQEYMFEEDSLFRIGGDEFILLLPQRCKNEATTLINSIQNILDTTAYPFEDLKLRLSASFGIVVFGEDGKNISQLLRLADERMYKDKQHKHRV